MNYIICNVFVSNSASIESFIDQKVMKKLAYNSKIKTQLPGKKGKDLKYNTVLVPILEIPIDVSDEMILLQEGLFQKTTSAVTLTNEMMYSIAVLFQEGNRMVLASEKLLLDISVLGEVTDKDFGITYSDGSFRKEKDPDKLKALRDLNPTAAANKLYGDASYGIVKLLDVVIPSEAPGWTHTINEYAAFTGNHYSYEGYSGVIENGSNNVGELSGLGAAVEHFSDHKYQIIISDSEYSIKIFREWYYNWKNNGFKKAGSKSKEVSNKELVQKIFADMEASGKIILFKWTKGHADEIFNEMCDKLAKDALGIKK